MLTIKRWVLKVESVTNCKLLLNCCVKLVYVATAPGFVACLLAGNWKMNNHSLPRNVSKRDLATPMRGHCEVDNKIFIFYIWLILRGDNVKGLYPHQERMEKCDCTSQPSHTGKILQNSLAELSCLSRLLGTQILYIEYRAVPHLFRSWTYES